MARSKHPAFRRTRREAVAGLLVTLAACSAQPAIDFADAPEQRGDDELPVLQDGASGNATVGSGPVPDAPAEEANVERLHAAEGPQLSVRLKGDALIVDVVRDAPELHEIRVAVTGPDGRRYAWVLPPESEPVDLSALLSGASMDGLYKYEVAPTPTLVAGTTTHQPKAMLGAETVRESAALHMNDQLAARPPKLLDQNGRDIGHSAPVAVEPWRSTSGAFRILGGAIVLPEEEQTSVTGAGPLMRSSASSLPGQTTSGFAPAPGSLNPAVGRQP